MSRRNFLPGDRALHDDAIIEARYKLAEKQSTLIARWELQVRTRDRLPREFVIRVSSKQRSLQIGVGFFQFVKMGAQYAADLVLDCLAREGRIEAFETNSRGFFRPERIDAEFLQK